MKKPRFTAGFFRGSLSTMVKKIISFFGKEIEGLHEAAYLLAFFAFLSQILALIRDRLLASYFGAGTTLDVYYAAFRIPDFVFTILIALVSTSILIPLIIDLFENKTEKEKKDFINSIFSSLIVLGILISGLAFIFAEFITEKMFPDLFLQGHGETLVVLTKIMLLQPILLALSGFFASFVQIFKKFFIYALSPILYNIGIIFGIVFLYPKFGIEGLAWGVVVGALLHLLIQLKTVFNKKIVPKFTFKINFSYIKEVLSISLPRTIALTSNQIAMLILISLAGILASGSISVFSLGFNLQSVPMAIIGVSYSMAAFPTLSRLFAKGERIEFLDQIVRATKHIIFWAVPVTVLFIVLRAQIVRTILGSGEFSWSDTKLVAAALALFSISVVAQSLILLFARSYYATGQTKKPLIYAIISVIATIGSSYLLLFLYNNSPGFVSLFESFMRVDNSPSQSAVLMLPLAFSVGQIINAVLLWSSFDREFKCFSDTLWRSVFHTVTASIILAIVSYVMLNVLDDVLNMDTLIGIFTQGFIAGICGIFSAALVLILLDNNEIKTIKKILAQKVLRR